MTARPRTPRARAVRPVPGLDLAGELTIHTAAERKAAITTLLESANEVRIGLTDVTELDTAGLQVLLLAKREAAQLGRTVHFDGGNKVVSDVLAIAHLSAGLDGLDAPDANAPREENDR